MPITAGDPTTVDAVYDKWGLTSFAIIGTGAVATGNTGPAEPVRVVATLTKYRVREDGVSELSPLPADVLRVTSDDVYALATRLPSVATALGALLAAVYEVAQEQHAEI